MTLEIKVRDTICVIDSLPQAEEFVLQAIREWYANENDQAPLTITLSKLDDRGPPTLGIYVRENVRHAERLAG